MGDGTPGGWVRTVYYVENALPRALKSRIADTSECGLTPIKILRIFHQARSHPGTRYPDPDPDSQGSYANHVLPGF